MRGRDYTVSAVAPSSGADDDGKFFTPCHSDFIFFSSTYIILSLASTSYNELYYRFVRIYIAGPATAGAFSYPSSRIGVQEFMLTHHFFYFSFKASHLRNSDNICFLHRP